MQSKECIISTIQMRLVNFMAICPWDKAQWPDQHAWEIRIREGNILFFEIVTVSDKKTIKILKFLPWLGQETDMTDYMALFRLLAQSIFVLFVFFFFAISKSKSGQQETPWNVIFGSNVKKCNSNQISTDASQFGCADQSKCLLCSSQCNTQWQRQI